MQTVFDGIVLSQQKYIQDLLNKASMGQCKLPTPMITTLILSAYKGTLYENPQQYRSFVGALQYVTITRPELAYSVNNLCQFMHKPLDTHWKAAKKVLQYLQHTSSRGLQIRKSSSLQLTTYSDADWASCPDDRKSTLGFCIYLGPNLLSWSTKKQHVVSRSSTEAEYRSLATASAELCWFRSLFSELRLPQLHAPILCCDNLSTIALAKNPVLHARTKHVEIDLYFVHDMVQEGYLHLQHVPSQDQIADLLTKPLSHDRFCLLRNKLNVVSLT